MSASVGDPPEYKGVSVEHPAIVEGIKNMARRGFPKERAVKLIGMPMEVVDRYYREVEKEKK